MSVDSKKQRSKHGLSTRGSSNVQAILPQIAESLARRTTNNGKEIDLSTAENWMLRPELLKLCRDAVSKSFMEEHFSYPSGFSGDPHMVVALCKLFNKHFYPHVPIEPHHVATAPGGMPALDALLYNICDPGDGVLIPAPYWNGFDFGLRVRSSVVPVPASVPLHDISVKSLIRSLETAHIASDIPIKALLISNPHNPLGICYSSQLLEACVQFCNERYLHLISDEVYALSVFVNPKLPEAQPFVSVLSLDLTSLDVDPSRIHAVWSTSKDFGQSGLRLGIVVSQHNKNMVISAAMAAPMQVSSLTTTCVTALFTSPKLETLIQKNRERLSIAYMRLTLFFDEIGVKYLHGNAGVYVFARIAPLVLTWDEEDAVAMDLKNAGVVVGMGKSYHADEKGWARVCFALASEEMDLAIDMMRTVLQPTTSNDIKIPEKRKIPLEGQVMGDHKRLRVALAPDST